MTCQYCDLKGWDYGGFTCSTKSFNGNHESATVVKTIHDLSVTLLLDGKPKPDQYYLLVNGEDFKFHPINYCPMCGRKLEDEK
ncbi:hypothetical protein [Companilactobacillus mishanensis]|uniref:Uncharacterized protein n=1 Tax=Companilactobacillus mishanensis TaxID=2486008 RepID=A0A5P0ZGI2_9LACO|nr:hypothetical protein [Companilactobacillus mishanensis]MQS52157.1 hypothetical protein [Companilactobacillus mishanensis]